MRAERETESRATVGIFRTMKFINEQLSKLFISLIYIIFQIHERKCFAAQDARYFQFSRLNQ